MNATFEGNFITATDMLETVENRHSPMKDFYRGKAIFLTGGTGFFGKLFIEKLIRCEVKEIILLIRPKRNKSPIQRLEELLKKEPVFTQFKRNPNLYYKKLRLMEGDLKEDLLGLSNDDLKYLTDYAQIVIHSAADVRFDESLKESVMTNVKGTKEMLKVSSLITQIEIFVYISTAYANCTRRYVEEKCYEPSMDPDTIIKLVEEIDEEQFDILSNKLIIPWPNTYAFAKALAENVVKKFSSKILTAVIRPSIVTATFEDPIPGWTDNVYGLNGVITGAGVGILRILHIHDEFRADIVPADTVINSTLAVGWHTVHTKNANPMNSKDLNEETAKVYHCVSCNDNPITWGEVQSHTLEAGQDIPPMRSLWVARYNTTKYEFVCNFLQLLYHVLPAFLIDGYLKLIGRTPRLLKVYRKVHKFSGVISFFTNNQWKFENANMRQVFTDMDKDDHDFFPCDLKLMSWKDFFVVYIRGLRQYIVHEKLDNLEPARTRHRKLMAIHYFLLFICYSVLLFVTMMILKFYGLVNSSQLEIFKKNHI